MKRPHIPRRATRDGDVRKDLTQEQLFSIGSVAIAYNEAELLVDLLLSLLLNLGDSADSVCSRINGMDGKIEIIKGAAKEYYFEPYTKFLAETLGKAGFEELKKYRDGIIHCRVLDAPLAIAISPAKRGKNSEILLSLNALEGVYTRLCHMRSELIAIIQLTVSLINLRRFRARPRSEGTDRQLSKIELQIQVCWFQARKHRTNRQSLPPLPEFPEELPATPATASPAEAPPEEPAQ